MRINSINNYGMQKSYNQNFGNAYVTLAKVNCADTISKNIDSYNNGDFAKMYEASKKAAQEVIDNVNSTLPNTNYKISTVDDLLDKVDLYVLAGGSGSRFKPLANAVATLRGNDEKFNKISVPFELGNNQAPLTMLDIPMAMGRFFAPKTGYEKIIAETPTGSFGDVIKNYMTGTSIDSPTRTPRDVVVCCGDNVFDMKSEDMLDYIVRTINNPDKALGVVGVARSPEEVKEKFGVLAVGPQNKLANTFPLIGFVEKPALEVAKKLTTPEGVNIANTGMFVIKENPMRKLLNIINYERSILGGKTNYIAKDEKEIYDFANATKWARNIFGTDASDVKMVNTWEDVGEQAAYQRWAEQLKEGHYLQNFTPERKYAILDATQQRVGKDSIQFSIEPKGKEVLSDKEGNILVVKA